MELSSIKAIKLVDHEGIMNLIRLLPLPKDYEQLKGVGGIVNLEIE